MNQNTIAQIPSERLSLNRVAQGDCVELMRRMPASSVDFILTDPPYLVRYRSRDGRTILNDADDRWLKPAFVEAYRVLRRDRFCISFYGWSKVDRFMAAWRSAGFRPVGHLVFRKSYASTTRFLRYQHEQAFLLVKGEPQRPERPIPDVLEMRYAGNHFHPTQKPVSALMTDAAPCERYCASHCYLRMRRTIRPISPESCAIPITYANGSRGMRDGAFISPRNSLGSPKHRVIFRIPHVQLGIPGRTNPSPVGDTSCYV